MAPATNHFTVRDLINSNACLEGSMLVRDLVAWFKEHSYSEFAAVFDANGIAGLVGRENLNARIAANKYGFSVLADKPILKVMTESPLMVDAATTVPELVAHLLNERQASNQFYDDIIVHDQGQFLGLASVKRLIVRQMETILEQNRSLQKQQAALAQKNQELFDAHMRLDKSQSQFKSFFENCSIPIVVFDDMHRFLKANARFFKISGHAADAFTEQNTNTETIFSGGIVTMLEDFRKLRAEYADRRFTYFLNLIKKDGQTVGCEVSCEVDTATKQIIISILRLTEALQKIDATQGNFSGDLGEFSVIDLAQMLVQGRKTGELTLVRQDGRSGVIYLDKGLIVHALANGQSGRAALGELLSIEKGNFLFSYEIAAPELTISGNDPMGLLMEAVSELDESAVDDEDDLLEIV